MNSATLVNLLGSSPQFLLACSHIKKVSRVDATVYIEGETGTGKELAARAIHYQGLRCDGPFVPVNCGALPETLIESELFGHERGAFTDAKVASPGLVSEAHCGTLFLDEVDALSMKAQASLLRFLQDRSYRRVGGGATRQADVRVIAASNANIHEMVEQRRFRRDLLYRLNVLSLRMPALRERGDDAIELAQAFLARFNHQYRLAPKYLHADSIAFIAEYSWPGNVRELENVIHREFLMSEHSELRFQGTLPHLDVPAGGDDTSFKSAKARAVADFERRYVGEVLQRANGNISRAARIAGQDRSAFGKLARKHGLRPSVCVTALEAAD
ncbi:sigma 54-interacting transcriptional regulator [Massilia sp. CCM 9210]|uniref:sigma-54 interaction domain-containing protein n=1 Tax=Massilia scottii TaxID=3057166 RepID=UPI0027969887|nr:sigma 54-interacting transcriptional regulator [Massilia sp. CCM 9210]MDQ1812058.1 sigma 54-interacting transcriptional regulator [Massilia sp. CCM 9210]